MLLNQYPAAIREAHLQVIGLLSQISSLKAAIAGYEAEVSAIVAFDPVLRNEEQRKSRKREMLDAIAEYLEAKCNLAQAEEDLRGAGVQLEFLKNEFSVLKLELRERISSNWIGNDEALDLVGGFSNGY